MSFGPRSERAYRTSRPRSFASAEVLDALTIHLEAAFAAAHVAAALSERSAIEPPLLLAAVKEPSRVVFDALGPLWDADVASSR